MLANAWFPHTYFKLSFGRQDKIAQQLDALTLVVEDPIIQFKDSEKTLPPLITLAPNQGFLTDWHYGSQAG
jgi:hypothetical protein